MCGTAPTKLEKTIDNVAYTTQYAYDAMGWITRTLYPDGEEVDYAYDAAGNLSGVAGYVSFSDYNALGQPGQIVYQNGVNTTRVYNGANNRLTGITTTSPGGEVLLGLGYSYDPNGNITGITDDVQPNDNQAFEYDGLNRLISATSPSYPNQTITMSYDAVGNLMQNFDSGKAANRAGQARAYDEDNRLVGVDAGSTSTFVYDYQGARVKKISGASETIYVGKHFQITDGVPAKHIFAGGMRIATKDESSIYYYHADHLGSLRVATDGVGARVQTVNYYPFGEIRDNSGSVDLPYKFTGQEYDPETGLYYYGARFYDPALGRFITPDSIVQAPADPQSLNRYAYCRNNPLAFVDPDGHWFWMVVIGILAGAGLNASIAAIQGRDIGMAALTGAISGGFFAGAGIMAGGLDSVVAQAMVHAAAGFISGGINAGITGGNMRQGTIISGISAGVAKYAMAGILPSTSLYQQVGAVAGDYGQFGLKGATAVATGTVMGGISSEMMGGSFAEGAAQGAWTSAYGFLFNEGGQKMLFPAIRQAWKEEFWPAFRSYFQKYTGMPMTKSAFGAFSYVAVETFRPSDTIVPETMEQAALQSNMYYYTDGSLRLTIQDLFDSRRALFQDSINRTLGYTNP